MHVLLRGDDAQRLRIASGLVLFAFATTHFLNHARRPRRHRRLMHEVQRGDRSSRARWPGTFVLLMALVTHMTLALLQARPTGPTLRLAALGAVPDRAWPAHSVPAAAAHHQHAHRPCVLRRGGQLPRTSWPGCGRRAPSCRARCCCWYGCTAASACTYWLRLYTPYRAAAACAAVRRHRRAARRARRLHGVGARRRACRSRTPQMLAEVKELTNWPNASRRRHPGVVSATSVRLGFAGRPAARSPSSSGGATYLLSTRPKIAIKYTRRADREGAARADPARDQPHAQHPARLGVRRARALLDLPRAHR